MLIKFILIKKKSVRTLLAQTKTTRSLQLYNAVNVFVKEVREAAKMLIILVQLLPNHFQ